MREEAALGRNWSNCLMHDWKALYYASAEDGMKTYEEQNSTQEIIHSHSANSENLLKYIDHPTVQPNELHSNGISISPELYLTKVILLFQKQIQSRWLEPR